MSDYLSSKYMLQRHLQELKDSLTFDDVRDKLYSKFVLTGDDLSSIDELDSNSLKVSTCLDIILEKNNDEVLHNFIKSLHEIDVGIYKDIYNRLTDPSGVQKMKEEKGNHAIVRGSIPRKHKTYITRKEEDDLEQLLTNQKSKEIIVLWGFPLVGKSCLASCVLQNPYLIFDHFKNKVFWLDLRNVTKHDQPLIADHLKRLIGCITEFDNSFDPQREQSLAWYKDMLRSKFLSLCDGGLLVLDNVNSEEVFQYFDIGCKMLIIVNRRECVIKHATKQIELKHFTEDQTAACFATALSVDVQQLTKIRPIIRKIHHCLEGHPNLVDLVATYLTDQEADQWNDCRWKAMLQRLQREGDRAGTGDSSLEILQEPLNHITNMLLELLTEEQKNYFIQLVIMPEHVNILPEVLIIYWGLSNLYEVEDILNRFHKLSLLERTIIKNETGERKIVYGLRNLFLKRIKSDQNGEFLINCHRKLLTAYIQKYGHPEMLPNDNYIYTYFGHHLLGANVPVGQFGVFLNLKFIGAKMKFCGVGEMLQDFRIYNKYITMCDDHNYRMDLTSKLDAYISFVEKCETNLLKNGLDLVQYALRVTDNHKIVFNDAMDIAKNSLNKLYLRWTFNIEPHFTRTLDIQNSFETVLFANDPKLILIGTKTGDIQLWDLDSRLMKLKFVGHTKGIKQLKLSPCKKYFVSVSDDMTLKVWKINSRDLCHSPNETAPLSPSLRQRDHHAFFADEACESAVGDSNAVSTTITVTSATFYKHCKEGDNSLDLITCPSGGKVMQWTFQEENTGFPLKLRGQLLVASNSRKQHTFDLVASGHFFLFIYSRIDKQLYVVNPQLEDGNNYVFIIGLPDSNNQDIDIRQILAVNDELCIVIGSDIHIVRFQYELRKKNMIYKQHTKYELKSQGGALSCASLTENASYLVTGTVDGLISLWDLKLMQIVKEFTTNNRLVMGLDTYTTPDSITLLLSGTDDYTVRCWHIASDHLAQHHDTFNNTTLVRRSASCFMTRLRPPQMISCYWPPNNSSVISNFHDEREVINNPAVAILDEHDNAIQIYNIFQLHTDKVLYKIDVPPSAVNDDNDDGFNKIGVTRFELHSNALYYALHNGVVRRYHLRTGMDTLLLNCTDRQIASLMCLEHNSILVECDRNSLTLIQCIENGPPNYGVEVIANILLDPSMSTTSLSHHGHIVRIFHLHHLNVRARIICFLVVYSSYVHVLCAESSTARTDLRRPISGWEGLVHSTYRMKIDQRDVQIVDCILSSNESHLVLFLSNGMCDILRLEPVVATELSYVSEYIFQIDPKVKITSSAISFDGQLLALGKENGDIEVVDVTKKVTRMILREHKQSIETLLFSPYPNYILVSAAKTICWWKLQETINTSTSIASSITTQNSNDNVWHAKQHATSHNVQLSTISECSRYLLSQISLPGPLKHVTASKDFTSFVTLDSLGIMHSFNVIA